MNLQTQEEQLFKRYLIREVLQKKGYPRYAKALKDFYVNITNNPNIPSAAVDATHGIIYINRNEMMDAYSNPDKVSMLIRHELLHTFLDHHGRDLYVVAKRMGLDPKALTKADFKKVNASMYKGNPAYIEYGSPHTGNIAGDYDLSRYYTKRDKEVSAELGGLILEDRPDWINMSFEEMHDALEKEGKEMEQRLAPKAYGKFNPATGEFEIEYETENDFATTEIDPRDIISYRLPTLDEVKKVDIRDYAWLKETPEDIDENDMNSYGLLCAVVGSTYSSYELRTVKNRYNLAIVLRVNHLILYGLKPGDTCSIKNQEYQCEVLDNYKILLKTDIYTYFDKYGKTNEYDKSSLHQEVDNFMKKIRGK